MSFTNPGSPLAAIVIHTFYSNETIIPPPQRPQVGSNGRPPTLKTKAQGLMESLTLSSLYKTFGFYRPQIRGLKLTMKQKNMNKSSSTTTTTTSFSSSSSSSFINIFTHLAGILCDVTRLRKHSVRGFRVCIQ